MEFQRLLLDVGKALQKDEAKALAFLCADFLGQSLSSMELASDLLSRLVDQDHLSSENPYLLSELLAIIQRTRLIRDLNLPQRSRPSGLISPYRKLLYNLSEEITDDDLKQMKFLLYTTLPRRKLDDSVTTLEVFLLMEHMDLLGETNLSELETMIQSVCPMLQEKINQFKALQAQPLPEYSTNHFNTSDFSHEFVGDQPLSQGLSSSSTETSRRDSLKVGSDALETSLVQEIGPSFKKPVVQTTNNVVLGTYPMTSTKRGICVIINNYKFASPKLITREGTMSDKNCLHDVFKWLGFEIEIHTDCESHKMQSVLLELSKRNHHQMDCMVCCILSHGVRGSVYGVDGHTVKIKELMDLFDAVKCPTLAKKPKLFFIQACQGSEMQKAAYIEDDGPAPSLLCSDAVAVKDSIPAGADFLQAMSTVPSFISFRDKKNGTWFIQSLCQNLVQMVPSGWDLVSILTKVNADVSQKTDNLGIKKQMPQPAFSLRKRVVFPVPREPPPSLLSGRSLHILDDHFSVKH